MASSPQQGACPTLREIERAELQLIRNSPDVKTPVGENIQARPDPLRLNDRR